jgi:hypothetical protein
MDKTLYARNFCRSILPGVLAIGAYSVVNLQPVLACDMKKSSLKEQQAAVNESAPPESSAQATTTPRAAGMKVFVDPRTGVVVPPPTAEAAEALVPDTNTSSVGLEEKSIVGGGSKVDLQGRFQKPLVATMGADGKVTIQHQSPAPNAEEKH